MFRTAELGQKVTKSEFNQRAPALRQSLLEVQANLRLSGIFPAPTALLFMTAVGTGASRWSGWRRYSSTDDTLNREMTGKGASASHRAADFQFGVMAFENVFDNR